MFSFVLTGMIFCFITVGAVLPGMDAGEGAAAGAGEYPVISSLMCRNRLSSSDNDFDALLLMPESCWGHGWGSRRIGG